MENIEEILEKRRAEIEQECSKRKIDLTATGLEDLDALTIALFLIKSDNPVESLYLGSNSISDEGMEALANSLPKHPELRHLYLGGNLFRGGGVEALSQALPDLLSLETLSLGGAHIDDTQMNNLASALLSMENTNLKHLYLNANCISDEGLLSLSVALSSGKFNLEILHLGDNEFGFEGIRVLADYLEHSKTLKQLFLNDNKLSFEALESLSESLCINRSLKILNLGNCGISDDMLGPLLATLSVNENLESLHIWGNNITEEGAELFLEVLKQHNHTLTDLQIFNNPIENYEDFLEVASIQVLKALLRENATSPADKRNSSIGKEASEVVEEKVENEI